MYPFPSMAAIQAEMAALPEQPRDVVGDVRVCRYLRFYSGDVAKVSWQNMDSGI